MLELGALDAEFVGNRLNYSLLVAKAAITLSHADILVQILWQGYMAMREVQDGQPDQGVDYVHIIGFTFSVFHFPFRRTNGEEGHGTYPELLELYADVSTHPEPLAISLPIFANTSEDGFRFTDEFIFALRGTAVVPAPNAPQCGLFTPRVTLTALPIDQEDAVLFRTTLQILLSDNKAQLPKSPTSSVGSESVEDDNKSAHMIWEQAEFSPTYPLSDFQRSPMMTRRRSQASLLLDSSVNHELDEGQNSVDDDTVEVDSGEVEVESEDEDEDEDGGFGNPPRPPSAMSVEMGEMRRPESSMSITSAYDSNDD
ncbi:hypothetical protein CYLTODRAFT_426537 [Cylindrobasidium torrendii FP15055 ss-10]|uniref:Uncharacterized protein n=1 Tax=Cylindrobasidium torrendii FP15055 ss-10 TaxID=1314674 RepID=A0A0D7AY73_9AGAR|nr:hypothetical protein CYLTODRAFT_426537 [Cylindrobasidium torrendii FP15055 ss-10]